MKTGRKTIRISVRSLVEFILRSGDLDNRRGGKAERDAMQAGSRLHRKIQRQMGSLYQAEVPLRQEVELGEDLMCVVEGRADGIFSEDGLVIIDEIKGMYRDPALLEEPVLVHLAQAKCYACFYAEQQGLKEIGVQMTYASLETEHVRRFRERYTYEELKLWFEELMREYEKWARFQADWKALRTESIHPLVFPFAYREGQRELAANVYRAVSRKKRLFIQAPTGVGKTISTVFPAVKAMGEGLSDKLFYLTAKTITRTAAEEAFRLLREQELRLKTVTLTAKEKLCICDKPDCNPEACPCAKGHFDRVNGAVYELLTAGGDELNRETVLAQAEKHKVCPFELSLDLSDWVDGVICDYNYVFDPNVRLKRFFSEGVKGDYLFLIDEAHNLVERGREMFSAALEKEEFLEIRRRVKGRFRKLERCLDRCNRYLLDLKRECTGFQIHEDVGGFVLMLLTLMEEIQNAQEEGVEPELSETLKDFWFRLRDFVNIYDRVNENYVIYSELTEDGHFWLRLYCVETADNLRECLDKGVSTIFFSATLLPIGYYKHLLGAEDDYAVYAQSPFEEERRLLLIGRDVSSRYQRRNVQEYERLAAYIAALPKSKKGNYLIFFPSYKMLLDVQEIFEKQYGEELAECIIQTPGMNEERREAFLQHFSEGTREKSLLGFCVMGGIFSEGIDLKHEALIGAVVVGTGLPQVCREREILKGFYEERDMDGFAYAYLYPGMNKVLQAAGRVIRTREDRGAVLLLDERFLNSSYKKLFPREWEQFEVVTYQEVPERLEAFWAGEKITAQSIE